MKYVISLLLIIFGVIFSVGAPGPGGILSYFRLNYDSTCYDYLRANVDDRMAFLERVNEALVAREGKAEIDRLTTIHGCYLNQLDRCDKVLYARAGSLLSVCHQKEAR